MTSFPSRSRLDVVPATQARAALQSVVDDWTAEPRTIRVLDAGCGASTRVDLPPEAIVVGIDISVDQLRRDRRLQRRLVGDIQSFDFAGEQFDLIICWDVLEHLGDPDAAMRTLLGACAPGGLVIVAIPNRWSLKGLVTRITPFRAHRLFYHYLIGDRRARDGAADQFPTAMASGMSPARLVSQCGAAGFAVRLAVGYEGPVQSALRARYRVADWALTAIGWLARLLTMGRTDLLQSDVLLGFQAAGTELAEAARAGGSS